jgi:hypothetical protein
MADQTPSTRAGRTRRRILEAARRLLEERGYHEVFREAGYVVLYNPRAPTDLSPASAPPCP